MSKTAAMTKVERDYALTNPKHYTDLKPEPITVIEAWGLGFHLGNCVKYIAREKAKDGLNDLKKARWYLDREIQRREPDKDS